MTDINPYAAPKAAVRDAGAAPGRPVWVWIIFVFYLLSGVSGVVSYFLMLSGAFPIPEDQKRYLAQLTVIDHALTLVIVCLNMVGAIQLFRLRRMSLYLFPSALALGLLVTLWHAAGKGWYAAMGSGGAFGPIIGWAISAAVCIYTWRLVKAGVVR